MKERDLVARHAYEAVISEVETQLGRTKKDDVIDMEALVISKVKSEIKKYSEMDGKEREVKILEVLLPKQLTEEELKTYLENFEGSVIKDWLEYLDNQGYTGAYDKALAVKLFRTRG